MKDKIVYMLLTIGLVWGAIACEDKDFEGIVSNIDDYVSETGGDYYEGGGIDVSHYDRARAFPGLVDTLTERRLDEAIVNIDLSRNSVAPDKVNLKAVAPAIYSTGLYAGAGEKITLTLDDDVKGLIVQIGVHTRDLSSLVGVAYLERDAKITSAMPLFQGTNEIRNPYGGYIWIKRTGANNPDAPTIALKVKGAYAAPDYIQGETDADEWIQRINETTVPWIELRGEQMAFSVPVKYMKRKLQQGKTFVTRMDEALRLWNDWMLCYNEFYGLDGEDMENYPDFPKLEFPFREVMDIHLLTERFSYFSTTNVELLSSEELIDAITDPEQIKQNALNICHVMGWIQTDMYTPTYFPTATLTNFKDMYLLMPNYYFLYKNRWWGETNTSRVFSGKKQGTNVMASTSYQLMSSAFDHLSAFARADSSKIFNDEAKRVVKEDYGGDGVTWPAVFSIFSSILSYKQVDTDKDGWKFFGYFNRFLSKQSEVFPTSRRLNLQDAMLSCLTTYFERDFSQVFDRWGIMVGDVQREEAVKYNHMEKCIWDYNPFKRNETTIYDGKAFQTLSGKYPYLHSRSDWAVVAYSGEGDNLKPKNYSYNFTGNKHLTNLDDNPDKYNEVFRSPYNLFDSDRGTIWSSYHDPYTDVKWFDGEQKYAFKVDKLYYEAETPEYPYSLVIQPGNAGINMDGVYMAFGYQPEASIYNGDVKDYQTYDFHPQHIIVEVTNSPLEYDDIDTLYTNIEEIQWKRVYDSKNDPKGGKENGQQFWPDRCNTFYIEFAEKQVGVTGVRLVMDTDSHVAKDRPDNFPTEEKPNRPKLANKYLNRIQKIAEFGTFYFKEN